MRRARVCAMCVRVRVRIIVGRESNAFNNGLEIQTAFVFLSFALFPLLKVLRKKNKCNFIWQTHSTEATQLQYAQNYSVAERNFFHISVVIVSLCSKQKVYRALPQPLLSVFMKNVAVFMIIA